ncbi:MAG TPA: hypothetical protein VFZ53_27415, partial [Polyangiaceae bacterium]
MTLRATSSGALLAAFVASGCTRTLPGFGTPPGGTGPMQAEDTQCGAIYEPVAALEPLPSAPTAIVGAADYHNHQFSNRGF